MSGLKSLRKGKRGEKEFREMCEKEKLLAVNQSEDKNKPDVRVEMLDCEVKYGARVPAKFYQWLGEKNANMLAIRRVSTEEKNWPWLAVMPMNLFLELLKDFFRKNGGKKDI